MSDETPKNDPLESEGPAQQRDAAQGEAGGGRSGMLPKPTFSTFVLSLASTALMQLGEVPDPTSGTQAADVPAAKHTIDMLTMLQEKIEKGLDAEEKRLLDGLLYELRMKYVLKI